MPGHRAAEDPDNPMPLSPQMVVEHSLLYAIERRGPLDILEELLDADDD